MRAVAEPGKRSCDAGGSERIEVATIDIAVIRRGLERRTTLELCEDYAHLKKCTRRMPWAEQVISDVLFARNENAWFLWQLEGDLFGRALPHRFFGLV